MLSLSLKRCIFHTQIREFVTFCTHNRAPVKEQQSNYCTKSKYLNVRSPNLLVHRLRSTKRSEDEIFSIGPLMRLPDAFPHFVPATSFFSYLCIRVCIDKDFRLREFIQGAKQAIGVTVNALCTQNYEALEGLVYKRPLKILKHRVNRLTPTQRQILGAAQNKIICLPDRIVIRPCKSDDQHIVEIKVNGVLCGVPEGYSEINRYISFFCYTFQRKYINNIGESWMIKIANHFSVTV